MLKPFTKSPAQQAFIFAVNFFIILDITILVQIDMHPNLPPGSMLIWGSTPDTLWNKILQKALAMNL